MKCPFIFPDGSKCDGKIEQIQFLNSDLSVHLSYNGDVEEIDLSVNEDVKLICSKKGDHASSPGVPGQLKKEFEELPDDIRDQIRKRLKE